MLQRRWRDDCNPQESWYGLGTMMNGPGPKEWVGHTGSLQGFVSRTARFTASGLTVTALANAQDGLAWAWVDGIAAILDAFRQHGAPAKRLAGWRSRWWTLWGCTDLLPVGDRVLQIAPALHPPIDATSTEIRVTGPDRGVVQRTSGYNSPGQGVRLVRDARGRPRELWVGGTRLLPREALVAEARARYAGTAGAKRR
jgi:D-alanyl-D-alanine carboxypeptidase